MNRKLKVSELATFVGSIPHSMDLEWVKDLRYLSYFKADRIGTILELLNSGFPDTFQAISVLDVGCLHGLIPELISREYKNADITVLDHPQSPVFKNKEYLGIIRERNYLQLIPQDISSVDFRCWNPKAFDVVILGELIEHMDPTSVAILVKTLYDKIKPGGLLIITTPNGAAVYNCFSTLFGTDVISPPIADKLMIYRHIHLSSILKALAEGIGLHWIKTSYSHGRELEYFNDS